MRSFIQRFPVAVFISLTLLAQFSIVLATWWLIPEGEHMHGDSPGAKAAHMVFRFRVFFPLALAMLLTVYLDGWKGLKKLFGSFFHWRVPVKWYVLAFTWKFILGYLGIGTVVLFALDTWPGWTNADWLPNLITTFVFLVAIAVVEETSWIRFSMTRLHERMSSFAASMIVGLSWASWYLMMMFLGEGVPDGIPWFVFILSMFSLTVLLTWAYNTTRSGTVLLIMQFFSNCAFLMAPMLPVPEKPPYFMVGFVFYFLLLAVALIIYAGPKHLHRQGQRIKWSDPL